MQRWVVSIIGTLLVACAGPARVRETVSRPRIASSASSSRASARSSKAHTAASKGRPAASRDAKDSDEDELEPQDFSGVAVAAPKEDRNAKIERDVDVAGIEGTMTAFDVRTPLEERDADFDRCHDEHRGGSGRIVFHIHILASGDVGSLKAHPSKVRSKDLIECYSEVVSSTHFSKPHGGYADVKWTTKVGRSRKKREDMFQRKVRWDTPAGGVASIQRSASNDGDRSHGDSSSGSEGRRERRHRSRSHRHH
ncbi:MAG: hypothetical protein ABW352_21075 [Polyangiales bacterium]